MLFIFIAPILLGGPKHRSHVPTDPPRRAQASFTRVMRSSIKAKHPKFRREHKSKHRSSHLLRRVGGSSEHQAAGPPRLLLLTSWGSSSLVARLIRATRTCVCTLAVDTSFGSFSARPAVGRSTRSPLWGQSSLLCERRRLSSPTLRPNRKRA